MRTKNAPRSLALVPLVLGLAACGGGGGGGEAGPPALPPATTIDAGNVDAVSSRAYRTATALYEATVASAEQLKSGDAPVRLDLVPTALARLRAATGLGAAGGRTIKAVFTETEACPSGGSITATANDADGNETPSAGDSIVVAFNGCVVQGVTFSGSLSISILAYASTAESDSARFTATFTNFRAQSGSEAASADGDMTLDARFRNLAPFTTEVNLSGNRLDVGGGGTTATLANYAGRLVENDTTRTFSYTVQGQVAGSGLPGTLTVSTPTAISGAYGADPTAGVLVVQGANNAQARLTVTPPSGVTVGLDANGDGTLEAQKLLTWAQLDAL